jgi:hypothetical protein
MAPHIIQGFLPNVGEEELAEILARSLPAQGYRERQRLVLEGEGVFGEVARRLERARAGSGAIVWFGCETETGDRATVFDLVPGGGSGGGGGEGGPRQRWDLALVRALSAEAGGFAAVMEIARTRGESGLALFYAGSTVEVLGEDFEHPAGRIGAPPSLPPFSGGDADEQVRYRFESFFRELACGLAGDLRPRTGGAVHAWTLERTAPPARDPYSLDLAGERPLTRAAFAFVDAPRFKEALRSLREPVPPGWRWTACRGPAVGNPFVLLEPEEREGGFPGHVRLDEDLFLQLARACGSPPVAVTAVAFPGGGEPFAAWQAEPGQEPKRWEEQGAEALLRVWDGLAALLSESPGALRWPTAVHGEPLAPPL